MQADPRSALVLAGRYAGCKVSKPCDPLDAFLPAYCWLRLWYILDGDLTGRLVEIDPEHVKEIKATNN